MADRDTVANWIFKVILPVTIIPLFTSYIVSSQALTRVETQQLNDNKRIDQVEKGNNINRVEISKVAERVSKIEVVIENLDRTLARQLELDSKNLTEIRRMRSDIRDVKEYVAVIRDREERDK